MQYHGNSMFNSWFLDEMIVAQNRMRKHEVFQVICVRQLFTSTTGSNLKLFALKEQSLLSDMLKAFDWIESGHILDFFPKKKICS